MDNFNIIQLITIFALPVIFAVTVHEASHGYAANYFGDRTAKMLGRLTLNPIKHIDPIGTIAIPLGLILIGAPFLFGWAKPVPVTERNLKNPRRQMAIIAAAGPLSNLVMVLMWAAICKLATFLTTLTTALSISYISWISKPLFLMGVAGVQVNLILMLLNILPLPPLDGSKILNNFLRGKVAILYDRLEPYGFIILLLLLATGILNTILMPLFNNTMILIRLIFGL
ncbi:MAG: site-2 protease family protein [Gammaproteobacteria bacterium]|nr:site-2 protease family protein [Gammaproteobacteria bacterium]